MSYAQALEKGWADLAELAAGKRLSVRLLADEYDIDAAAKTILSKSCNIPAKEYVALIILHYLIRKLRLGELPKPSGEWVSFNELEGGEGYYPAFKKRTIKTILKKYGSSPAGLAKTLERFKGTEAKVGDVGVVIDVFENVPILITMWRGDDEFGPDANIHFDRDIGWIFCTEDIVVMTEIVAHSV